MNILNKYTGCFVFAISLLMLIGLQLASINPIEQDRFFYFSLDMIKRGPTFFPYVKGAPYPDYIALVMIMSDAISRFFGHVSVFSVGLPYCIAGALMVTFTYLLGATHSKRLGLMSAYFCLLSWKFLDAMSALDLDIFPALSTVICIYLAHLHALSDKKPPLIRFVLLWLFGYFCRGPIGLLIPAMITGLYYFTDRQWKISIQIATLSLCAFIITWVLLLFMAYQTGGKNFMHEVMGQQGFGRLVNEHAARYYFFFTIGLIDYAFTSFFALLVGARYIKSIFQTQFTDRTQKLLIFSLQWAAVIILFFTLPATKKARYIMPLVPAISLLSAYPWITEELQTVKKQIIFLLAGLPLLSILIATNFIFLSYGTAAYSLLLIGVMSISIQLITRKSRFYAMRILMLALIQLCALHLTVIEPITLKSLDRFSMVPWF